MLQQKSSDEGFSLIEVMFAVFVTFFVLTAIFGLVVTSHRQTVVASRQTVATNLANEVIEEARSVLFDNLGTVGASGGEVSGVLPPSETITYEGLQFTVDRQVIWVDDPTDNVSGSDPNGDDYKELIVVVSWQDNTGGTLSMSASTKIRGKAGEQGEEGDAEVEALIIEAPAEGDVLFNLNPDVGTHARIWAGDPAAPGDSTGVASLIGKSEVVVGTDVINRHEFYVDALPVYNPYAAVTPNNFAMWQPDVQVFTNPAFPIYTLAYDPLTLGTDYPEEYFFPDGPRQIEFQGWTSSGHMDSRFVNIVVDNYPPEWAADAAPNLVNELPEGNTAKYESKLRLTWPVPTDGFFTAGDVPVPVTHYNVGLGYDVGVGHTFPVEAAHTELPASGEWIGNSMGGWSAQPFTPYRFRLWALSPRGLEAPFFETGDETTHMHTDWVVTSPQLTGSARKVAGKYTVSLSMSPPNFPASFTANASPWGAGWEDHITYDVYMDSTYAGSGDIPGAPWKTGLTWAAVNADIESDVTSNRYYQVEAVLPAVDFLNYEVASTTRSNVVFYNDANHTVTVP
jgi:type II secretory pathway pseudopilin PulG